MQLRIIYIVFDRCIYKTYVVLQLKRTSLFYEHFHLVDE